MSRRDEDLLVEKIAKAVKEHLAKLSASSGGGVDSSSDDEFSPKKDFDLKDLKNVEVKIFECGYVAPSESVAINRQEVTSFEDDELLFKLIDCTSSSLLIKMIVSKYGDGSEKETEY